MTDPGSCSSYAIIQRLIKDASPDNTFRRGIYTSITGGGGTGKAPLFFATDVHENRAHRARFGAFLRSVGLVSDTDWVVTVHTAGDLYRYVARCVLPQLLSSKRTY